MTVVAALRKSYRSFDAAHYATDHAANNCTDRTGVAITHSGAVLAAVDYALCLRCGLYRKNGSNSEKASCCDQLHFHGQIPFLMVVDRSPTVVATIQLYFRFLGSRATGI